ncbi:MAG TPA: polysaccharide pyruvyl transferase CsaB [Defluviitaleaceae bacterium]|nr:polysaccharide pyruvyl transferase CsaB [Candidatus Epulonipiscium sp.]HOA80888.1 polysaccharide pyruvyl transferase CsaB [Defluviitaleaceae bacterium]
MGSIVLSGYYGFNNAGDEAVLYAIINTLKDELKDIDITVLSNSPEDTAKKYNVKAINRWSFREVVRAIKKSDLLISGGGSLLQDITSWKSILYYLFIILIAKIFRKKVVIYSQGIGPVSMKFNRILIKWIINKTDYISVRDEESKEELKELGIKKDIEVVPDPVMAITLSPEQEEIANKFLPGKENKKRLGVYLRDWEVDSSFYKKIINVLKWALNEEWQIVFVPMHHPEDIKMAKELSKDIPSSIVYEGDNSPINILSLTNTMDYIISMRLHGLIMSSIRKVPFIGLSYDPKVDRFIQNINVGKVFDIHDFDENEIIKELKDIYNKKQEINEIISSLEKEIQNDCKRPAKYIAKILNNN